MKYNQLGNSDLKVSEICLGTMTFGEQNTEDDAHDQLDMAADYGVNFIDTAEMYPVAPRAETQGLTEAYVGSWLKHQKREDLIVATKITGPSRGFEWIRGGPRVTAEHINAAIDGSLKRLQTDYVDLYQIHWPDRYVPMFGSTSYDIKNEHDTTPIMAQLEALSVLVDAGKVRYIGLSNETPYGVSEFNRCAKELGLPHIVSIQNAYHLLNRTFEAGLAETCRHENVGLLAYSPLAFGHLSGKYLENPQAKGRVTQFPQFTQRYSKINVPEALQAYAFIAENAGLTLTQLGLAFVRSRWFTSSTIIGATNLEQLKENLETVHIEPSEEVFNQVEKVHQQYPNPAP
ncbi:MAG TPA: aldo/keto reductase [Ghiorsea sp.]|nr:aldo/keto reductase [Ghiorsea sp.]